MGKYRWIDESVEITFAVPKSIQEIIDTLEELDRAENYAYFNVIEDLDCSVKEYVYRGVMSQSQWDMLCARYEGGL